MAINLLMAKVNELEKKLNNVSGPFSAVDEDTTNRVTELAEKLEKLETSNNDDKFNSMEQTLQVVNQKTSEGFESLTKRIEELEKALEKERIAHAESSKQLNNKISVLDKKLSAESAEPTPP